MKPALAVDWDGTCVEQVWPREGDWLPGAKKALRSLSEHYTLVIHTCRVAPVLYEDWDNLRPEEHVTQEVAYIQRMLDRAGIEAVIWQRGFKPPAVAYIDDKAIRFTSWERTMRELKREGLKA